MNFTNRLQFVIREVFTSGIKIVLFEYFNVDIRVKEPDG